MRKRQSLENSSDFNPASRNFLRGIYRDPFEGLVYCGDVNNIRMSFILLLSILILCRSYLRIGIVNLAF